MQAYPYKVDYNDHFETPLTAYKDIQPILEVRRHSPSLVPAFLHVLTSCSPNLYVYVYYLYLGIS